MQVGRRSVENARGVPCAVEEEEGGHGGNVAEGAGRGRVGDRPVDLRTRQMVASVNLVKALGGGWEAGQILRVKAAAAATDR